MGNSQGIPLSKRILADANLSVGDSVDVAVRHGVIVVTPVKNILRKTSLRRLVARFPKGYEPEEIYWGRPVGQEVW